MVAGPSEVSVVGRSFLVAVCWADTAVHVENDLCRRTTVVHTVDPMPGKIGKRGEVFLVESRSAKSRHRTRNADPKNPFLGGVLAGEIRTVAPETVGYWSLTTLREKLIKIDAITFQLTEVAIPKSLFATRAIWVISLLIEKKKTKWGQPVPVPAQGRPGVPR